MEGEVQRQHRGDGREARPWGQGPDSLRRDGWAIDRILAEHRDGFKQGYDRAYFELSVSATIEGATGQKREDNFVINDAEAFGLWLNAFEYHRDESKRQQLIEKLGAEPDDLTLAQFRRMIADKARAVLHVAGFLDDLVIAPSARGARKESTA